MSMKGMTEKEIAEKYGTGKYGVTAICNVITGEKVAKFTIVPTQWYSTEKFDNGTDSLKVSLSDLPKMPKLKPNNKVPMLIRIKTNPDQDGVDAITPVRGHFMLKLVDLGPRADNGKGEPFPKEKVFHEGKKDEERHLEFFAVYEITEGAFKGVRLPAYWLHYKFMDDGEGNTKYSFNPDNPKATRGQQVREWMILHGLDSLTEDVDPIPWDDETILPTLLERALENDVQLEGNLKDGYILRDGGLLPSDYQGEFESEEESESDEDVDEVEEAMDAVAVDKAFPKSTPVKKVVKTLATPAKAPAKKIKKHVEVDEDDEL